MEYTWILLHGKKFASIYLANLELVYWSDFHQVGGCGKGKEGGGEFSAKAGGGKGGGKGGGGGREGEHSQGKRREKGRQEKAGNPNTSNKTPLIKPL